MQSPHHPSWRVGLLAFVLLAPLLSWLVPAAAMRPDRIATLRQHAVDMFYHGYDNYMDLAFPEDELRPLSCTPLTRDRLNPNNLGLNDVLGNYSLTLVDTLSSLAILASAPSDQHNTGPKALRDFQDGVAALVEQYGDGTPGPSGRGRRARGFDLDSKIQVFETVIRGVGGLLSAHLFAVGELPIRGYQPRPPSSSSSSSSGAADPDDPLHVAPIAWPNGFHYDGQLLRLALDLANRLLPAFYTSTGMPYPRVNLRHGIPFFPNSPLHQVLGTSNPDGTDRNDITETCSAGAGSLVLEFTVLSRLTGDARFEQIAKRAFWSVWNRRSEIGLIGAGVDAEQGNWIGGHSVIGAGADSFFEYALKSHILLSGHDLPNLTLPVRPPADSSWLDPNELWVPLTEEQNSPDAFLDAWHHAHAAIKRHLYDETGHPHYSNVNIMTGSLASSWIDSLGAYYPGLLTLAGELEEAMETNLLHAAIWTKYAALPERWSIKDKQVEGGLGWWPLRPEFIESTYHLYRATKDTWYLYVGEMVMADINRRCRTECGFAGIQNVVTGELSDRMETFFLGETAKYLYLLYDEEHPLNSLDAAYVFTTEGHPLIIPKSAQRTSKTAPVSPATTKEIALYYYNTDFRVVCPVPPERSPLTGSGILSRPDLFHAARMLDLHTVPNIHAGLVPTKKPNTFRATQNYTYFPWTLPPDIMPDNATCDLVVDATEYHLEFGMIGTNNVFDTLIGAHNLDRLDVDKIRVNRLAGLKLAMRLETGPEGDEELRVTKVNGFNLGRDEHIVLSRALLSDVSDTKFKLVRDLTTVKIHHVYEVNVTDRVAVAAPQAGELLLLQDTDEEQCTPTEESDDLSEPDLHVYDEARSERTENILQQAQQDPAIGTLADNINTLFRALWSQVRAPSPPNASSSSSSSSSSSQSVGHNALGGPIDTGGQALNVLVNTTAITPTGPGAAPLPPVDMAPHARIPAFGPIPAHMLPWTTIYAGGDACDAILPEEGPRDHHIIVLRRGRCAFSTKLAHIPAYKPSAASLQLVIVVSDDEEDGHPVSDGEAVLSRPLLAEEQRTPTGLPRRHAIPMVMMGGGEDMYRRLTTEAARIGMTRKYGVESDGRRLSNVIIDDGEMTARH